LYFITFLAVNERSGYTAPWKMSTAVRPEEQTRSLFSKRWGLGITCTFLEFANIEMIAEWVIAAQQTAGFGFDPVRPGPLKTSLACQAETKKRAWIGKRPGAEQDVFVRGRRAVFV
jgi:hypothetical protein